MPCSGNRRSFSAHVFSGLPPVPATMGVQAKLQEGRLACRPDTVLSRIVSSFVITAAVLGGGFHGRAEVGGGGIASSEALTIVVRPGSSRTT
jgi:hypothetical protein